MTRLEQMFLGKHRSKIGADGDAVRGEQNFGVCIWQNGRAASLPCPAVLSGVLLLGNRSRSPTTGAAKCVD